MNRLVNLWELENSFWKAYRVSRGFLAICRLQRGCLLGGMFLATIPGIVIGVDASSPPVWAEEPSAVQPVRLNQSPLAKSEPAETSGPLPTQLQQELGQAGISEEANPLLSILQQMREVEMLLSQGQTGSRTQQIQKEILAELDRLIEQAQKSGLAQAKLPTQGKPDGDSSRSVPGAGSPGEPKEIVPGGANQSTVNPPLAPSTEEKPADAQQVRTLLQEVWGLLPPAQRQKILETPAEEFLPKYKHLIIDYFRRLTELRSKEKYTSSAK